MKPAHQPTRKGDGCSKLLQSLEAQVENRLLHYAAACQSDLQVQNHHSRCIPDDASCRLEWGHHPCKALLSPLPEEALMQNLHRRPLHALVYLLLLAERNALTALVRGRLCPPVPARPTYTQYWPDMTHKYSPELIKYPLSAKPKCPKAHTIGPMTPVARSERQPPQPHVRDRLMENGCPIHRKPWPDWECQKRTQWIVLMNFPMSRPPHHSHLTPRPTSPCLVAPQGSGNFPPHLPLSLADQVHCL